MIRIGILGSDNSHALAFSKLCNIPDDKGNYLYDDVRVTAIYGHEDDPLHTKEVAEAGKIELIAEKPEDFYGNVDAVMVVTRAGRFHAPLIIPFIEKGYPVWIDKPITSSPEDIDKLREACEKHNALVTGGSTVKYVYDVLSARTRIESGVVGEVLGGNLNFAGNLESQYDGLFFYSGHIVEMMLTVFGYDVKSVTATNIGPGKIVATVKYDNFMVNLNLIDGLYKNELTVYGSEGIHTAAVDISICYKQGFSKFIEMLKTNKMPLSFDKLVKPVYVIDAIVKALNEKREVKISGENYESI